MTETDRERQYVLAPYIRVGFMGRKLYFGFGSISKKIDDAEDQEIYLEAGRFWKDPHTRTEVTAQLEREFPKVRAEKIDEAIGAIVERNYLVPADSYDPLDRYARHLLYYALSGADITVVQEKLRQKRVAVLGCGGIGNLMATSLATAGIGDIILVDGDVIELSNLTRQIVYSMADVGRVKVDTLRIAIEARAPETKVVTIHKPVCAESLELLPDCDLLVLSADVGGCTGLVNTYSIKHRTPWINIGYVEDIAIWGPFVIPGQTGCYRCQDLIVDNRSVSEDLTAKIRAINRGYQSPSSSPVNMMSAAFGLLDCLRYLGEFGEIQSLNKRIGLWTHNLTIETQSAEWNRDCPECGRLRQEAG